MLRGVLAAFLVAAACCTELQAQDYPSKPISLVTGFGAGSGSNMIAQLVAQQLQAGLKQSVVVDARPGASGVISARHVARSPADGYTLMMTTNSQLSAAPFLIKNIAYDPVKDFAPVSRIGNFPMVLVVGPSVSAKSMQELIAYAKANPGKLTFASSNSSSVIGGETFKHLSKLDMVHVPYKSTPQALTDILAGRVSMMVTDATSAMPYVQSGRLRSFGTTGAKRSALYPDLSTMAEAGVPGFDLVAWAGLVAPANTPPEVVGRLNKEMRKIVENPEMIATLAKTGFEAIPSSPQEFEGFIKTQLANWEKMVKDAGIQPQ